MDNLTKEDWADWAMSHQTKEFVKILESLIVELKINLDITIDKSASNDAIARTLSRSEGFCEGVKSVISYILDLKDSKE